MQEDMRLTLQGDAGEPERPWHEDLRGVVGYVRALAGRVDRVEALQARAAHPAALAPGMRIATGTASRRSAIAREIERILAGPGYAAKARDPLVRTAVADLQRALGLLPDGLVGDQTLCAVAELSAGLGTPVVDEAKTR